MRKGTARFGSCSRCTADRSTASATEVWKFAAIVRSALEQFRPALAKLQANDIFIESNLTAAVSAIAGQYQRLGYAQAKVAAAVNDAGGGNEPAGTRRACSR